MLNWGPRSHWRAFLASNNLPSDMSLTSGGWEPPTLGDEPWWRLRDEEQEDDAQNGEHTTEACQWSPWQKLEPENTFLEIKNNWTVYLAHDKSSDHTHHVKCAEATAKCRPPCRGGDLGHVDSSRRRSEAKSQAQEDSTKVEEVDVRGQGGAEEPGEEEGTDQATGHPSSKIFSQNSSQKTGGDCGKGK